MSDFLKGSIISSSLFIGMKSHFFLMDIVTPSKSDGMIPSLGEKVFRWLPYVGILLLIFIAYFLYQRNKKKKNSNKKNSNK